MKRANARAEEKHRAQQVEDLRIEINNENSNLNLTLGTVHTMRLECATQREQQYEKEKNSPMKRVGCAFHGNAAEKSDERVRQMRGERVTHSVL